MLLTGDSCQKHGTALRLSHMVNNVNSEPGWRYHHGCFGRTRINDIAIAPHVSEAMGFQKLHRFVKITDIHLDGHHIPGHLIDLRN